MKRSLGDQIFAHLSNEMILICDEQMLVREANPTALEALGKQIIGQPLTQLSSTVAQAKAEAFADELRQLNPSGVSTSWELLLHSPHATPLLAGMRGGRLPEGGWMIMGASEAPRLTALYYEVLAINTELTNMIRELIREQSNLSAAVKRLAASHGPAPAEGD